MSLAVGDLLVGCRSAEVVCPLILERAVVLTIVDSLTNAPPAVRSSAFATSGTYYDSLITPPGPDNIYPWATVIPGRLQ